MSKLLKRLTKPEGRRVGSIETISLERFGNLETPKEVISLHAPDGATHYLIQRRFRKNEVRYMSTGLGFGTAYPISASIRYAEVKFYRK